MNIKDSKAAHLDFFYVRNFLIFGNSHKHIYFWLNLSHRSSSSSLPISTKHQNRKKAKLNFVPASSLEISFVKCLFIRKSKIFIQHFQTSPAPEAGYRFESTYLQNLSKTLQNIQIIQLFQSLFHLKTLSKKISINTSSVGYYELYSSGSF